MYTYVYNIALQTSARIMYKFSLCCLIVSPVWLLQSPFVTVVDRDHEHVGCSTMDLTCGVRLPWQDKAGRDMLFNLGCLYVLCSGLKDDY